MVSYKLCYYVQSSSSPWPYGCVLHFGSSASLTHQCFGSTLTDAGETERVLEGGLGTPSFITSEDVPEEPLVARE